jgi:hypothetical protein
LEPVWRPLDPAAPFADADAANVEGFLGSIHSARPASQPAVVASQARRHAEARLALVPTAPTRGLHQPIARPMISGGLSPRNASTNSAAPPRAPPPPGPTAGIRPAPVATAAPAAAKPPAGSLAPGSRRPDALDWLALAGVVAALAIIFFDWPGSPQTDSPPPAPRTSGMMRNGLLQHRRKQR